MTDRIQQGGLQVASVLHSLLEEQIAAEAPTVLPEPVIPGGGEGFPPRVLLFDRACGSADDMQAIWDDGSGA